MKQEPASKHLHLRIRPSDLRAIKAAAKKKRLTVSTWVRQVLLRNAKGKR